MRQFLLTLLLLTGSAAMVYAADGYTIKLKFTDYKDKKIFLAHYYGKPLPTIYRVDSATVDAKGVATLDTKEKIIGGLYLLVLEGNSEYFEFLLDNGQKLDLTVDVSKLPLGVTFKNNPENERFFKYMSFLKDVGTEHQSLSEQLAKAKTKTDSTTLQQKIVALSEKVSVFRKDYMQQNSGTLLGNIFNALEMPQIPQTKNADGTINSEAWYRDYKKRYWDNVDFKDERLTYTPLLDNRMDIYFTKLVQSNPDSFNADADALLAKARASNEIFKYMLHWITMHVQESNIMGMDAVFVHLVENYYMRGDAYWLNQEALDKYVERAKSIAPNVIGNVAPEIRMKNIQGGEVSLSKVKSKYTLLVFWSPDCGHCLEEIPRVDSALRAEGAYKNGVSVIAVNVDRDTAKWQKVIAEKKLDKWTHAHDPERTSNFRAQYDVYGTPSIYLLDDRKIIRGKKLDHGNVGQVIKMLEEQSMSKKI